MKADDLPLTCLSYRMYNRMPYAERREAILNRIDAAGCIYVNCKHQVQLKDNHEYARALRRMLKEGLLKMVRVNDGGRKSQSKLVRKH